MSLLQKEKVKARMMQNAASLWGVKDSDIEVAFDPLVTMLIEGCVNEVEKINNEIKNTDARIIKHLAQLITPDIMTGYRPSHAIMQARPAEEFSILKPEVQFYHTKKAQNDINPKLESNADIYFSPVSAFKLVNGSVKYMAYHDSLFENTNAYQKKLVAEAENLKQLERGCVWLALDTGDNTDTLPELSFFIDIKNNPGKSTFINLLPYTKWSSNGLSLEIKMGLPVKDHHSQNDLYTELSADERYMQEILMQYNQHFITLTAFPGNKEQFPAVFESVFLANELKKIPGKFTWIKVEFNIAVDAMLPDLVCGINCFPVVNKKLNEFVFRLSQNLNIVPLKSVDYFFSVRGVYTQEGTKYTNNPLSNTRNLDKGTYVLRQGGIERFDSRNAAELITYLLNLLRDESGSFTVLGNEFISSNLKQLNQTLALIEQRIDNKHDSKEAPHYLFVTPFSEGENIYVSYWTTNGNFANNIKAGNKMELYGSGELKSDSLVLVTTTRGGRAKLDDSESLTAFKSAQLSRDRIVTPQDIRLACFHELGKEIEDVTVKKGFMVPNEIKSGFIQTVDVRLRVSGTNRLTADEWVDICENLSTKIMKNSTGLTPVRVMLDEDAILYTAVKRNN